MLNSFLLKDNTNGNEKLCVNEHAQCKKMKSVTKQRGQHHMMDKKHTRELLNLAW